EEWHIGWSSKIFEIDDQTIENLGQVFNHTIDLARSHTDTHTIDGGVGAPVNDDSAGWGDLHPVAMPPDARKRLEIALTVTLVVGIVPEVDWHGWHRLGDNQFAYFILDGLARLIEGINSATQAATLNFSRAHRQNWASGDEPRADICSAADRGQPDIGLYMLIDPLKSINREWRAG